MLRLVSLEFVGQMDINLSNLSLKVIFLNLLTYSVKIVIALT